MANSDKPELRVVATDGVPKADAPHRATLNPDMTPDAKLSQNDPAQPETGRQPPESQPSHPAKPAFNLSDIENLVKNVSARDVREPATHDFQAAAAKSPQSILTPVVQDRAAAKKQSTPGFDDPLPPKQTKVHKQVRLGPDPDDRNVFNYIFTVGRPGSGKTTFQSHMLRYLNSGGEHVVEADPVLAKSNVEFRDLFLEWQDQWDRGHFPRRSEAGRPLDFRYIVTPNLDGFPPIRFGFLEISGEDFIQLAQKAVAGRPPELLRSIDEFLNNPKVNIAFLFVCQGQDLKGDDLLFSQFLEYVKNGVGRDFQSHCSAALIIADPETCQRRLAHRLKRPEIEDEQLDIDTFIRQFLPSSAARLARWKHRATIATFSVGTIVEGKNAEGKPVPLIADPSFEDAKLIYDWLYHRFTGKRIGVEEGFIPKIREWLRKLAELGGAGR